MRKLAACDVSTGMNCGEWVVGECGACVEDEMDIPGVVLLVLPFERHGVLALVDWFSNKVSLRYWL